MKSFLGLSVFFLVLITSLQAQPPTGYYNSAVGLSCADLKTALRGIISSGTPQSYNNLWSQYQLTDIKPREVGTGSANVIWDVYSDIPGPSNDPYNFTPGTGPGGQQDQGSGGGSEGQYYNREHSVPLSWFGGNTGSNGPATDYLHIMPTDKAMNGKRANWPYGEVGSASFTSMNGSKLGTSALAGITGTVFEPIDSFKGDVARAFLYFVTRYENNMASFGTNSDALQAFEPNTYPSVDIPFLEMMISWHNLDPVSIKEQIRNNGAYSLQGNRNPYIDHPEYVGFVWNNTCPGLSALPVNLVSFGGKIQGDVVKLGWTVKNEMNFDRYEIERSFNGERYSTIGVVKAINAGQYSYNDNADKNRGRQVYYRLKKVDKDGKFTYSAVLILHIPFNTKFNVYPNPATTYIQLQLNKSVTHKATIEIADVTGKIVISKVYDMDGSVITIAINKLTVGTYLVNMLYNDEQYIQKFVVVK